MKRKLIAFGLLIILVLQGCTGQATVVAPAAVAAVNGDAPVNAVEVLRLDGNTPDVRVVARGSLPDGCVQVGQEEVEREGALITVHLPARRPALKAGESCAPGPVTYERVVRLPLDQAKPGKYVVLVNGQLGSFELAAAKKQAAQPAAVGQPKTAAQPAASQPAVQPTPVPLQGTQAGDNQTVPATGTTTLQVQAAADSSSANQPAVFHITPPEPKFDLVPLNSPVDPNCNKVAFFGDLTIPAGTAFDAGETFVKTWRVRNEGTCTWGAGYKLVFAGGYKLGGQDSIALPDAAPGKIVNISVPMTAPTGPGMYDSAWAFASPDGQPFGTGALGNAPLTVRIGVRQKPPDTPEDFGCGAVRNVDFEKQIFDLINQRRAEYGLPPHKLLDSVSVVARGHSVDMACRNKDTHYSLDGMLYTGRLQRAGIPFDSSNEIIFAGNGGPKGAVYWWMEKSKLHRSIILSNKYSYIGIGVVVRKDLRIEEWFTIDFITPPGGQTPQ